MIQRILGILLPLADRVRVGNFYRLSGQIIVELERLCLYFNRRVLGIEVFLLNPYGRGLRALVVGSAVNDILSLYILVVFYFDFRRGTVDDDLCRGKFLHGVERGILIFQVNDILAYLGEREGRVVCILGFRVLVPLGIFDFIGLSVLCDGQRTLGIRSFVCFLVDILGVEVLLGDLQSQIYRFAVVVEDIVGGHGLVVILLVSGILLFSYNAYGSGIGDLACGIGVVY